MSTSTSRRLSLLSGLIVAVLTGPGSGALQASETCLPGIETFMQEAIEDRMFPGIAVKIEHGGRVIFDQRKGTLKPDGPALPDDAIWRIYSMTKPITSLAVMMLAEDGRLALDDPFSKYVPAFANMEVHRADGPVPAEQQITVRDLLRHTSGVVYGFFGTGAVREAYKTVAIRQGGLSNAEMAEKLAGLPLENQPGTTWEYSLSTDLLGHLVEVVTGQTLGDFYETRIFDPLGMKDTAFEISETDVTRRADGFTPLPDYLGTPRHSGGGGLVSTVEDYMQFLRMVRNGGELNGARLLSAEGIADMSRDHTISSGIRPGRYYLPGYGHGFGLGYAVKIAQHPQGLAGPVGTFFWGGYAGTAFWVDPVNDVIAVAMVQTTTNRRVAAIGIRRSFYEAAGTDGAGLTTCN
jgi:CubicO group peptidase (beta-lactamase class C family)